MLKKNGTHLSSLLIMTMLVTGAVFAASNNSVSAIQEGAYTYSISSGVATITAYTGAGGAITIPSTLGGYSVSAIGASAFNNAAGASVTSIVIPNGVTSIGDYAFTGCTYLASASLGTGIVSLGSGAFEQCSSLTSVTIPDKVTSIRGWTFYSCTALTTINIGNGVTSIGDYAFNGCSALTSVTIPNKVTSIGISAFDGCSALTSVTIPDKTVSIGTFTFFGCSALTTVTMGSGVVSLGSSAFYSCDALTTINFLGLVAPTSVAFSWVADNPSMLNGHAYAASNFPRTGDSFNGLLMGSYLDQAGPSAPSAPRDLQTTAGNAQVSLSWIAPSSNGGSAIDYYIVYQAATDILHLSGTSATITGLTNGQTYTFTVAAHNSAGIGAQSSAATAVPIKPITAPVAPTGLSATPGDGQVAMSWTAPASNGGAAIDYCLVYINGVAGSTHYTTNYATITGLTNGQTYTFTVAAHNSAGIGAQSSAVTAVPKSAMTVPGAPTGLSATPGNGQVAMSWVAPGSIGGTAIDYYLVYINGVAGSTHYTTNYATITGLTNGQTYTFTVAAHNSAGIGAQSSAATAMPIKPITAPGAPTDMAAVAGNGQVALSWKAPASNGGAAIDYCLVYVNGVAGSTHYTTNYATITGLTNGQTYTFTVAAHNSVGIGAQSSAVTAMPKLIANVPTAPSGLTAVAGNGQVALSWKAPASNGGAPIDYCLVYVNGVVGTGHLMTNYATITGLTNGQSYVFTVAHHNSVGIGVQSSAVTAMPKLIANVPTAPSGLTAVAGNGQVALSWKAPASNGGAPIDYCLVYVNGVVGTGHLLTNYATITGLTNGQTYTFTVAHHNSVGIGAQSSAVTAMPKATVPSAPTGMTAVAGNGQVALSWKAPATNGGAPIDYCLVYVNGIARSTHLTTNYATITGLTNGQTYTFTVAHHNSVGIGVRSAGVTATPHR